MDERTVLMERKAAMEREIGYILDDLDRLDRQDAENTIKEFRIREWPHAVISLRNGPNAHWIQSYNWGPEDDQNYDNMTIGKRAWIEDGKITSISKVYGGPQFKTEAEYDKFMSGFEMASEADIIAYWERPF